MICAKCNSDLADCECPDLPERVKAISRVMLFGPEYAQRILTQVQRVQGMNELKALHSNKESKPNV